LTGGAERADLALRQPEQLELLASGGDVRKMDFMHGLRFLEFLLAGRP